MITKQVSWQGLTYVLQEHSPCHVTIALWFKVEESWIDEDFVVCLVGYHLKQGKSDVKLFGIFKGIQE